MTSGLQRMRDIILTTTFIIGLAILLAGIAFIYLPAAAIIAGLAFMAMAVLAHQHPTTTETET